MGELKNWAEKESSFLRIESGETVFVKYLGYKFVENRFDPEQTVVRYYVEVNGDEKTFESRSLNLARDFDEIKENTWVKIKRTGEGAKTKYEVESEAPSDEEIGEEDLKEADKKIGKKK